MLTLTKMLEVSPVLESVKSFKGFNLLKPFTEDSLLHLDFFKCNNYDEGKAADTYFAAHAYHFLNENRLLLSFNDLLKLDAENKICYNCFQDALLTCENQKEYFPLADVISIFQNAQKYLNTNVRLDAMDEVAFLDLMVLFQNVVGFGETIKSLTAEILKLLSAERFQCEKDFTFLNDEVKKFFIKNEVKIPAGFEDKKFAILALNKIGVRNQLLYISYRKSSVTRLEEAAPLLSLIYSYPGFNPTDFTVVNAEHGLVLLSVFENRFHSNPEKFTLVDSKPSTQTLETMQSLFDESNDFFKSYKNLFEVASSV